MTIDQDEVPTSPQLPVYKCPECRGAAVPCDVCHGERLISRHVLAQWHARTQGR
jgi:predicted hydrocarbon binding protein